MADTLRSTKLIDENPLLILPSVARAFGLNECIVLQQLHFLLNNAKANKRHHTGNFVDGYWWVYNSYLEWQEVFPFWSTDTIKRIFKALEDTKVIIAKQLSKNKTDRRKWYRIDYEAYESKMQLSMRAICPDEEGNLLLSNMRAKSTDVNTEIETTPKNTPPNGEFTSLIKAWLDSSKSAQVNPYANKTNRKQAQALYEMGITADDVSAYCNELLAQPFWSQQGVKFDKVANGIGGWKEARLISNGHTTSVRQSLLTPVPMQPRLGLPAKEDKS